MYLKSIIQRYMKSNKEILSKSSTLAVLRAKQLNRQDYNHWNRINQQTDNNCE
uniref:Uncharacterized protein n=1 Tax=Tetranychus urticae TaxID=32264 RepID=T1L0Q8_TETUR